MFIGLILVVIGLVFFGKALGLITTDAISIIWPLLVIVLGISMITHHRFGHHCKGKDCCGGKVSWGSTPAKSKKK